MINRDRFALLLGIMLSLGALASGDVVAEEHQSQAEAIVQKVGLSASSYKYTEDDVMSLKGPKFGLDYAIKFALTSAWFLKGDARYARGKVDYQSNATGTSEGHTDWYFEWRLLSGYDFALGNHTIGPFTGVGYRYLYNDLRGTTSTGHIGYRRESRYLYLPLGLAHRWSFGASSSLTTTIEYDYLIEGRQTTELGDVYNGTATPLGTTFTSFEAAKNDQKHGHGWRGSVMLQLGNLAMGPYVGYWRLSNSETDDVYATDDAGNRWVSRGWYEPKNKTTEAGFKVFYSF